MELDFRRDILPAVTAVATVLALLYLANMALEERSANQLLCKTICQDRGYNYTTSYWLAPECHCNGGPKIDLNLSDFQKRGPQPGILPNAAQITDRFK
jgi:hypothetical protein